MFVIFCVITFWLLLITFNAFNFSNLCIICLKVFFVLSEELSSSPSSSDFFFILPSISSVLTSKSIIFFSIFSCFFVILSNIASMFVIFCVITFWLLLITFNAFNFSNLCIICLKVFFVLSEELSSSPSSSDFFFILPSISSVLTSKSIIFFSIFSCFFVILSNIASMFVIFCVITFWLLLITFNAFNFSNLCIICLKVFFVLSEELSSSPSSSDFSRESVSLSDSLSLSVSVVAGICSSGCSLLRMLVPLRAQFSLIFPFRNGRCCRSLLFCFTGDVLYLSPRFFGRNIDLLTFLREGWIPASRSYVIT
ncbi:ropporin-1-like protein isoform X1 [Hypanus sabinus]|uniref:ropporin-1-like protein isoform X1 n=1 Tax=Hypanus sabinus TaxID=79690 RepID=UPI0028C4DE44|nr:ropporin-1-like protein isoform X1 [Hypanus sabinus]